VVLNDAAVRRQLNNLAYVPIGDRSDEFAAHIKREIARLGKMVRDLKLSAE
jgi:tripartite-type tricarboxylate transporter receptor subunit TctC